jgi:sensor histidine kinase YesM
LRVNLVRNAIEALRDAADGKITLSAARDLDGRIVIAVVDNGPGIASDQRNINLSANRPLGSNCGQMNTNAPTTYEAVALHYRSCISER